MVTAEGIFDQAIEMSNINDPDLVTDAQWLSWLSSFQKQAFLIAAKENPDFFGREGNTSARSSFDGSWSLTSTPGNVAAVSKLQIQAITGTVSDLSVGSEVNMIPIRSPDDDISPRVYIRNKTIFEYNGELGADSSNFVTTLKVFYSFLPPTLTATSDSLDLPEEFNDLVVLPLASRLALRDQRAEEAAFIQNLYREQITLFIQQLSVFDEGVTRELEMIPASARPVIFSSGSDGGV